MLQGPPLSLQLTVTGSFLVPPCSEHGYHSIMFSIEHEFDATVVTLVDEGAKPLQEDVIVSSFEECVTVEQYDPRTEETQKVTLSISQMRDLVAAVSLPEGVYTRPKDEDNP